MQENDDELITLEEDSDVGEEIRLPPWKVLIADDEPEIHTITKMVLTDLVFERRNLTFLDAYTAAEVQTIMQEQQDIAVILLDVVMENDHSGLDAARYIRDTLKNHYVRIILRTGQPGQAPERNVITTYDINDYKEKSELTSQKLFTTVMAALRSYRDIMVIDQSKRGLEQIIKASLPLFRMEKTIEDFASAVLEQLAALLNSEHSFLSVKQKGFAAYGMGSHFEIISGTSDYSSFLHRNVEDLPDPEVRQKVDQVIQAKQSLYLDYEYVGFFMSQLGFETVLYLRMNHPFSELDRDLLQIFSTNITLAFDNLTLNQDLQDTQQDIVCTLGQVIETRSTEPDLHVKRVVKYAVHLGELAGLSRDQLEVLQNAVPLHDLGKIAIPDAILFRTGPLSEEECRVLQNHTTLGSEFLRKSRHKILQAAAVIALQHHERWDGSGYPAGLKGEQIDLFARITKIADSFDSLSQKKTYKEAWSLDRVKAFFSDARGTHFDPMLTDLFLTHFDRFATLMMATK